MFEHLYQRAVNVRLLGQNQLHFLRTFIVILMSEFQFVGFICPSDKSYERSTVWVPPGGKQVNCGNSRKLADCQCLSLCTTACNVSQFAAALGIRCQLVCKCPNYQPMIPHHHVYMLLHLKCSQVFKIRKNKTKQK